MADEPDYITEAKRASKRVGLVSLIIIWLGFAVLAVFQYRSGPKPIRASEWVSIIGLVLFGASIVAAWIRSNKRR